MKTLNDYQGAEGIDKLLECAPYINELISDKETMQNIEEKSWIQLGGELYKAHTETCNALFRALDHEPENAISAISATAQVMAELLTNKDLIDFFISLRKEKSKM
ncbi:hypothetical protein [Ruminococcus flavefaciens]|uniref:hypothetical protein n=1 Tax=Ruminococcus flavefaciens TaxID=1265 RepID=UPI0026F23D98|nr:hypothetical protein [Ruminococcus flavefaciens]